MSIGTGQWIFGIAGTWFILTAMAEIPSTSELASALALSIAVTATFVFYAQASKNLFNAG